MGNLKEVYVLVTGPRRAYNDESFNQAIRRFPLSEATRAIDNIEIDG
jgi:hypothetical protein